MNHVIRMKFITREYVRQHPTVLFMFGDNMERIGLGGQAGAMRGEPNAVGVPTKWRPSMDESAFFTDDDIDKEVVQNAIRDPFLFAKKWLISTGNVVIPEDGLGTGLSELPTRAPRILRAIEMHVHALEAFGND
ncbi:MAG: hypothetical protein KGI54_17215 [Pseudomonadota bacterium]|nr:hypothetical protein [Pseudomonadota bacterium]